MRILRAIPVLTFQHLIVVRVLARLLIALVILDLSSKRDVFCSKVGSAAMGM